MIPEIEYYKLASKDLKKLRKMKYEMEKKMMTERFNKFIEENYDTQNTKNEQQKDLCITSEQLTEQWKKGELPSGWYYVKGSRVEGIYAYTAEYLNNMYRPRNGEIIIEQVPSYEEWIGVKQQRDLENKLRHDSDNKNWQLRTQNTKLKELLRECLAHLTIGKYGTSVTPINILCDEVEKVLQ